MKYLLEPRQEPLGDWRAAASLSTANGCWAADLPFEPGTARDLDHRERLTRQLNRADQGHLLPVDHDGRFPGRLNVKGVVEPFVARRPLLHRPKWDLGTLGVVSVFERVRPPSLTIEDAIEAVLADAS